ncbi:3-hydroxyacyl-CoA dehydrogenase [Geobacter sp. AOG1]|uniref:3-hydroxyacyl-CoA dehydrogenase n=1 Tax=Geobacter sp. AOG1 TaxID=1566346 RepID=UPI001CC589B8|nr:3-hydroxyacyl-CoA dehydrogenase [Geobacter sp. AOG1]GFE57372.1 3-hydroxyacyl-CoA dehydrogenase [Geobacter sp. AOG1]
MSFDAGKNDLVMGIIGTGVMGRGIAQIAAQAGVSVLMHDAKPGAALDAQKSVHATLSKLAEKGKITAQAAEAAVGRISIVDGLEGFSGADIVVEAIVENIQAKHQLFQSLEGVVGDSCLLATNTSSLSVTEIAAGCRLPGRVGGFHFFNPVPLMKIVEVIDGILTEPWVGESLTALAVRMGHTPVRAKDTPGFIVNHAGRGYVTEALRILGEGIAEHHVVDRILRQGAGFRMGPFELLDLTALDVSHPAMEAIYNQYYQEPRLRPSPIARQRLMAGLLGRKVGRGFYTYTAAGAEAIPEAEIPAVQPTSVWVSAARPAAHAAISGLVTSLGAQLDHGAIPASDSVCIVMPLGADATTACLAENLDPTRTVAIDTLFGLDTHRTIMTTPLTAPNVMYAAHGLFGGDGVPVSVIRDSAGFVAQRVLAVVVNTACDIVQQRVTSPCDLDRAVTLGLGYPKGPLAWGDSIGAGNILGILNEMMAFYGDPRYRPSPWLTRRARLGVSLLTPEN